jgi:hypothetical protein
MNANETKIQIQNLTMAYGSYVVMRDINAEVKRGSVFVVMGNSVLLPDPVAQMRGALPEQRALEFHDAGRERRAPVG